MKNLSLLMLMFIMSFCASAQRYADIETKINLPKTGDTAFIAQKFTISVNIKNNGPDTIKFKDTLAFELSFDGSIISFGPNMQPYLPYSDYIESGDSVDYSFGFTLGQGWQLGTTEICVRMYPLNPVDTIIDSVALNDKSCVSVIVYDPSLSIAEKEAQTSISVYPNPAKDVVNVTIANGLRMNDVTFRLMDVRGQVMKVVSSRKLSGGDLQINTSDLPAGMYFYMIDVGEARFKGKLTIQ